VAVLPKSAKLAESQVPDNLQLLVSESGLTETFARKNYHWPRRCVSLARHSPGTLGTSFSGAPDTIRTCDPHLRRLRLTRPLHGLLSKNETRRSSYNQTFLTRHFKKCEAVHSRLKCFQLFFTSSRTSFIPIQKNTFDFISHFILDFIFALSLILTWFRL
jgi:hypothetical protein